MVTPKTISRGIAVCILVAILGYAYFEARPFLSGPQLSVTQPIDGFSVTESPIVVSGSVRRITEITLNGNPIVVDEEGVFERLVPLAPGYAVIEVSVKDRFGRTRTETLHGTYTPQKSAFPPPVVGTSTEESLDATTTTDAL